MQKDLGKLYPYTRKTNKQTKTQKKLGTDPAFTFSRETLQGSHYKFVQITLEMLTMNQHKANLNRKIVLKRTKWKSQI